MTPKQYRDFKDQGRHKWYRRTKRVGVYGIRHKLSGRMYVGGSTDVTGRFTHHRFCLRRGAHKSAELQKLWDRDGEGAFEFVTLEWCLAEDVFDREQEWHERTPDSLNTFKDATQAHKRARSVPAGNLPAQETV